MLALYLDGPITAGEAADRLGAGTVIAEVILHTARHVGRLPDRTDPFAEGEFRCGLTPLRLGAETSPN